MDDALELACELIRRDSVTPDDMGCQQLIRERLQAAEFSVESLPCNGVDNLWAIAGNSGPLLCLAGHTDVVPPGPESQWQGSPFAGTVEDGWLLGRGAADMKSGVAALVCAAERFRQKHLDHPGRLAVLLTSDEEGPAVDGTHHVVDWLQAQGTQIDYCILGEPSSNERLGDTVKNGRRGSLNARITVRGTQGHVAYPHAADNALHKLLPLLNELLAQHWDDGDAEFQPTSFQISNLNAGTGAENVIPGSAEAWFNLRFNPQQTPEGLQQYIESRCQALALDYRIDWHVSGRPFVTREGKLIDAAISAVEAHFGQKPQLSTGGGTSDGRYIAPSGAQVIEFGPINATIHKVNERIEADHVGQVSRCYETMIELILLD